MKTPHYTPEKSETGTWEFTTPIGATTGIMTRSDAIREAENTKWQDMATAAAGVGIGAETLMNYFATGRITA